MDASTTELVLTVVSLVASIASLVLAVVAIWIALYGKHEAERINRDTQDLLMDVRSDAGLIAQYALPELKAYGESARRILFTAKSDGRESPDVVAEVTSVIAENMNEIRGQLQSISSAPNIAAVRDRLPTLEQAITDSEEDIRSSLFEAVKVSLHGKSKWTVRLFDWEWFLSYIEKYEGFPTAEYGNGWVFVDSSTDRDVPSDVAELRHSKWRALLLKTGGVDLVKRN